MCHVTGYALANLQNSGYWEKFLKYFKNKRSYLVEKKISENFFLSSYSVGALFGSRNS